MKGIISQIITEGKGEKAVTKAVAYESSYLEEYKSKKYKTRRRIFQVIITVGIIGVLSDMFLDYAGRFGAVFVIMFFAGIFLFNTRLAQPQVPRQWFGRLPHPYVFEIAPGEYKKDDVVELEVIITR